MNGNYNKLIIIKKQKEPAHRKSYGSHLISSSLYIYFFQFLLQVDPTPIKLSSLLSITTGPHSPLNSLCLTYLRIPPPSKRREENRPQSQNPQNLQIPWRVLLIENGRSLYLHSFNSTPSSSAVPVKNRHIITRTPQV